MNRRQARIIFPSFSLFKRISSRPPRLHTSGEDIRRKQDPAGRSTNSAPPGHRGADRQLGRLQALSASSQRPRRHAGQAFYLGGGLRRERRTEPPFSPAGSPWGSWAAAATGLASQIASDTATICSVSAANSR